MNIFFSINLRLVRLIASVRNAPQGNLHFTGAKIGKKKVRILSVRGDVVKLIRCLELYNLNKPYHERRTQFVNKSFVV